MNLLHKSDRLESEIIQYNISSPRQLSLDSPPTEDLQIAKPEREAINQVISQLDITGKSPKAILERVDNFFLKSFRYSLKLTGNNQNFCCKLALDIVNILQLSIACVQLVAPSGA
ncbi:MAG: hypothetical protein RMY34_32030 [Aulosira sp. DedQUE10]|nr:hypothetical protein [Aulosira sp. DedQUE10]